MPQSAQVGRAGFDVVHDRSSKATPENRRRILRESARHLDPQWTADQVARNENVDPSRTAGNFLAVNDGKGGWLPVTTAEGVEDVIEYGEARRRRVHRKIQDRSFTTTRIVCHLPKTLCEQRQWTGPDGRTRRYWAAKDEAEMFRYLETALDQVAQTLPGGRDAIHGWALNVDEYTPHVQVMADTFGEDPKAKDPARDLRVMANQAWGEHAEVRDEKGRRMMGGTKMARYQQAFRDRMADEFPEADIDRNPAPRSKSKHAKEDFVELQTAEETVESRAEALAAQEADQARRAASLAAREASVDRREELAEAKERAADVRLLEAHGREVEVEQRERGVEDAWESVRLERERLSARERVIESQLRTAEAKDASAEAKLRDAFVVAGRADALVAGLERIESRVPPAVRALMAKNLPVAKKYRADIQAALDRYDVPAGDSGPELG